MARPRVWGCAFAALALLSGVALPACSLPSQGPTGGAILPPWQFVWVPTAGGADASLSPQAAFTNAGRAAHLRAGGGNEHLPVAVGWLATGRTFGVAVVQLDPAGHFWNLVWLVLARSGQVWQAEAGDLPQPTPCGPGRPFSGPLAVFGPACTSGVVSSGVRVCRAARTSTLWTAVVARPSRSYDVPRTPTAPGAAVPAPICEQQRRQRGNMEMRERVELLDRAAQPLKQLTLSQGRHICAKNSSRRGSNVPWFFGFEMPCPSSSNVSSS
jgi:hypothetical protein